MIEQFFSFLNHTDDWLWSSIAVPIILIFGIILTLRFKFVQIRKFPKILRHFLQSAKTKESPGQRGSHPLEVFFASIGGCIGIGNIVAVCTAVQIGGPGAIFWMWVAALFGMIIKYSEVYLGVKFRVENKEGGYDGGPMYYLQRIWKSQWIPILFSILLAIYGTEIYMFSVITHSVVENWHVPPAVVVTILLSLILYASNGGISRVGKISSWVIPLFLVIFCAMSGWIFLHHLAEIPRTFALILKSAFTGHAPLGGFAGSGILLVMSQGMARGCYTGDIGVGYASIVHAESSQQDPKKQAQLVILGIFLDTFIVCTFSTLLILVTGVWNQEITASQLVQSALASYFPYMEIFMPLFLFLLGYSSLIAFFVVGLKCARFLHPKNGAVLYYLYASAAFLLFSILDQSYALTVMSISGAILLIFNVIGIYKLRKEIEVFD